MDVFFSLLILRLLEANRKQRLLHKLLLYGLFKIFSIIKFKMMNDFTSTPHSVCFFNMHRNFKTADALI